MTLWGHCYEEGSLSLPYLAFVEAIRSYVLDRETDELKKELGSGASDVARIVSEVREKLRVEPREAQNPEEDRYRLMQSVTSFLANAANVKPMLVVLEDLHDADKGTLEMLSYVSRNLTGKRLIIIGTYRDVEVDRNHPLSAALAELRRVSSFGRVLLRGLNVDEVRRMLARITHEEIPVGLAEAVHRQTEGNPLFVQEVVRYLTEEKLLKKADGRMVTDQASLELNIPEGLRDVIGKRLSHLSPECNQLLSAASIIGREFSLDTLRAVTNISEDTFINGLKEAVQLSILEERSQVGAIVYRFTHAFFRQTLYEEMIAPQRLQLHQQVARVLETQYEKRLGEHAVELAEHFSQSTDPADLKKAVEFSEMAAQRASGVYAYGEVVRMLDQALKVQRVLDLDDREKMCDLLLDLGEARNWAGEPQHSLDIELPEALSIAETIGDSKRVSRAFFIAMWSLSLSSGGAAYTGPQAAQWIEIAERYAEPGTLERAWADAGKSYRSCLRGSNEEGLPIAMQALEQARTFGDKELIAMISSCLVLFGLAPWSVNEALELAEELAKIGVTGLTSGYSYAYGAFLICGNRRRAEDMIPIGKDYASRTGQFLAVATSMSLDASQALLDGNLEEAVEILERIIEVYQVNDERGVNPQALFVGLRAIIYLGINGEYRDRPLWKIIPEWLRTPAFRYVPLYMAHREHTGEVNERLDWMLERRPNITTRDDLTHFWLDIAYLESAVMAGHHNAAELLLERFKDNTLATTGVYWPTCIARQLGTAAAMLERHDEAREHYKEANRLCTEMRFKPELALTRLQLAELLLDHYPGEKKEALEHLDFAIKEFREMKMQPSLERALRRKEILKA